jgi:sugar lactone lactonase YvrE
VSDGAAWSFVAVDGVADGRLDGPAGGGAGLLLCLAGKSEIHRLDAVTGAVTWLRHTTSGASSLAVGPDGSLYGGQPASRRVVWYRGEGTYYLESMLDGTRQNDPQDLVVDATGAIWLTDDWTDASSPGPVNWPPLDHRSVLRLARVAETDDGIGDWHLTRVTSDTEHPHGIAISRDGSRLIVTDRGTPATLRAYPIEGDRLGEGLAIRSFATDDAIPDSGPWGMTVADDGSILVALGPGTDAGSAGVLILGDDGTDVAHHDLPDGTPTNLVFGGPDCATLFVTTDRGLLTVDGTGLRGIEGGA